MFIALFSKDETDRFLGSGAPARLARLGVTQITLLTGPRRTALVLQGWAFDPDADAVQLGSIIGTASEILNQAVHMVVAARQSSREMREFTDEPHLPRAHPLIQTRTGAVRRLEGGMA
jgi:hypothetical protein